jgi:hypothetical protein
MIAFGNTKDSGQWSVVSGQCRTNHILRRCVRISLIVLVTGHWSLATGHFVQAAVSKGKDQQLEAGGTNQGGGVVTSSQFRQQLAIGDAVAGSTISTSKFRIFPGLLGTTFSGKPPAPLSELDISVLYAKAGPMGAEIEPERWQTHPRPVFVWEAPSAGLDLVGYSYAFNGAPDDTVDTTGTSLDTANEPGGKLADGKQQFSVKALNTAGQSGAAASIDVWIDTTAPQAAVSSPPAGGLTNVAAPVITASASDAHSGVTASTVTVLVNGSNASVQFDSATGTITSSGAAGWREGPNSIELRVKDAVGNAQAPLIQSVTVDTSPPEGTIEINGGASVTTSIHVVLGLTAADALAGVDKLLLSNHELTGYVEEPFVPLRELWKLNPVRGVQKVYVQFVDKAGNRSEPVWDEIDLALLAPETVITSGPAGFTPSRGASFAFLCPEGGCVFSYAFDTDEWSDWESDGTASKSELVFGNHYFRVKAAKETNGIPGIQLDEEDPSPAERAWVVGVEPLGFNVPKGPPIKVWRLE